MKRLLPFLLVLGGCVHHGSLASAPPEYNGQMASDAAKAMRITWPPANTVLKADAAASDPFLCALIENLRSSGYTVEPPNAKTGSALRYVVDRVDDSLFRVSILIDGRSLNRLYRDAQGRLTPASAWLRQE